MKFCGFLKKAFHLYITLFSTNCLVIDSHWTRVSCQCSIEINGKMLIRAQSYNGAGPTQITSMGQRSCKCVIGYVCTKEEGPGQACRTSLVQGHCATGKLSHSHTGQGQGEGGRDTEWGKGRAGLWVSWSREQGAVQIQLSCWILSPITVQSDWVLRFALAILLMQI